MKNMFDKETLETIKQSLHNFFRLTFGKDDLIAQFSEFIGGYLNQKLTVNLDSNELKKLVADFVETNIETNVDNTEKYDNENWLYLDNLVSGNKAYAQIFKDAFWEIYDKITTGSPEDYDYAYDLLVTAVKSKSSNNQKLSYESIIGFVMNKISYDVVDEVYGNVSNKSETGTIVDLDILYKLCSETVYLSTAANKLVEIYGGKASNYFSVIEEFANENGFYILPLGENKLVDKLDGDSLLEILMFDNPVFAGTAMGQLVELLIPAHKPTKADIKDILDGNSFKITNELVSQIYDLLIDCYGDANIIKDSNSLENGRELGKLLSFDNFDDFPIQNIMNQLGIDEDTLLKFQSSLNDLIYIDTYLVNIATNFDRIYPDAAKEYNFDTVEMVKSFMLNNNYFVNDNQTMVDTNELLKLLEEEFDDFAIVSKIIDKLVAEYEEIEYDDSNVFDEEYITEIINSVMVENSYKPAGMIISDYAMSEIYRIFND